MEAVCGVERGLTELSDAMAGPKGRQAALSEVGAEQPHKSGQPDLSVKAKVFTERTHPKIKYYLYLASR